MNQNDAEAKTVRKKHLPHYLLVAFIGLACILFSAWQGNEEYKIWWETLTHIGQALIIGPTISVILDLPSMINYFKKVTIRSLVSEEYINTLSRRKLLELRKKCTARIHLKGSTSVEQGLIEMDEKVCGLLTESYHERYRQTVSCRLEGDFVVKKHYIEELIMNPLSNNGQSIKIEENMSNFLFKKPEEQVSDIFKILKYNVSGDNKPEENYLSLGIKAKEEMSDSTDRLHNSLVTIVDKDNKRLVLEFYKHIKIEKSYEVRVPKEDITFLKRVKIPVKSFRLDYHFPQPGIKLIGTCFGTLTFTNDGSIKVVHENDHISVESYSWLLPGNGVFIVVV